MAANGSEGRACEVQSAMLVITAFWIALKMRLQCTAETSIAEDERRRAVHRRRSGRFRSEVFVTHRRLLICCLVSKGHGLAAPDNDNLNALTNMNRMIFDHLNSLFPAAKRD